MYPVDVKKYPVNCAYGVKGVRWTGGVHKGVDQACPVGTVVRSPVDGIVVGVGVVWGQAFGRNQVAIEFVSGSKTYTVILAHMSSQSCKVGQKVKVGQVIGKSGKDGNVSGPHVHMEVQKQRRWLKDGYVDPVIAINYKAV
jgi:murein DD-endopeptidase MepM/ murein hydrolase activator NlpD